MLEPEGRDLFQALTPHGFLKRNLLDPQQPIERLPLGPRGKSALRHHQLGFAMRRGAFVARGSGAGAGAACTSGLGSAGCAVSTAAGASRAARFAAICLLAL